MEPVQSYVEDCRSALFRYVHNNRIAQQMISSSFGAIFSSLLVTPFDVVKTRVQSQTTNSIKDATRCAHAAASGQPCAVETCPSFQQPIRPSRRHYTSTVNAIVRIAREEGVGALWKGLPPTILASVPSTVLYFSVYENLRDFIDSTAADRESPLLQESAPLASGILARVATVATIAPFELVRTRMQALKSDGAPVLSGGVFPSMWRISKEEGLRTLWRGLGPTLFRDVPFSGLYWYSYENIKKRLLDGSLADTQNVFMISFASGALSGSLAASLTVPFDVVKTRMQVEMERNGTRQRALGVFKDIVREEGVRGLFAGIAPRVAKVTPACAIMISSYEIIKRYFELQ